MVRPCKRSVAEPQQSVAFNENDKIRRLTLGLVGLRRSRGGTELAAGRANYLSALGGVALCVTQMLCAPVHAQNGPIGREPSAVVGFPIASDARLAGDSHQTRFVLDLDNTVPFRAFLLSEPYRVVVDLPQVSFHLPTGAGTGGRGLVKAFRYGLVMPGGSRIVFDLTGPARIANSTILDAANGQPPRLVLELEEIDEATFARSVGIDNRAPSRSADSTGQVAGPGGVAPPAVRPPPTTVAIAAPPSGGPPDTRPVIVIDPGHGGIDYGTQGGEVPEKTLVLAFGQSLRDRLEHSGKFRVVMTRDDDTFIPLGDRVRIAQKQSAALFVSIHADALPRGEGDAQGATIYTLADKASDVEAERLAEAETAPTRLAGSI